MTNDTILDVFRMHAQKEYGNVLEMKRFCKWWITLKRILLPAVHILLPNYTNFKNIRVIQKFGVCNHVN